MKEKKTTTRFKKLLTCQVYENVPFSHASQPFQSESADVWCNSLCLSVDSPAVFLYLSSKY